ncbi:MAG: UDP-N-acetylmuramate--L-alanine ligase [Christensenellales bacterium]
MIHIDAFKGKKVYFIGIGGCSMNGLAQIMRNRGYIVSGSDKTESNFTQKLKSVGIAVAIGHDPAHIEDADLVVFSAAIKPDNPELKRAQELGIPCIDRALLLGQISSQFQKVVCVAGCHGKTTITSMTALIYQYGSLDATVHLGGESVHFDSGIVFGHSDLFLTEACEYMNSFLTLSPSVVIVNNIDDDHLDYFKNIENICETFEKFINLLPEDGVLIAYSGDPLVHRLMKKCPFRVIPYGFDKEQKGYSARNIIFSPEGYPSFDCYYANEKLFRVSLQVPGEHNVQNALAAIAASKLFSVDDDSILHALNDYRLTKRRMELYGQIDGVSIYHDYAHHPSEIKATLKAMANMPHNRIWCIFQCNSYSRAITLMDKYGLAFGSADTVLVPDIYPGRDIDTGAVHARDLVASIRRSCANTEYIPTFEGISAYLHEHWRPGDIVVGVGSGDIYVQIKKLFA